MLSVSFEFGKGRSAIQPCHTFTHLLTILLTLVNNLKQELGGLNLISNADHPTPRGLTHFSAVFAACISAASVASYFKLPRIDWFSIPTIVGVLFICYIQVMTPLFNIILV